MAFVINAAFGFLSLFYLAVKNRTGGFFPVQNASNNKQHKSGGGTSSVSARIYAIYAQTNVVVWILLSFYLVNVITTVALMRTHVMLAGSHDGDAGGKLARPTKKPLFLCT